MEPWAVLWILGTGARLCKMQVDKMRNSRIALWLAARHRIGQWQQCRKCQLYFYWWTFEYSSFVTYAKVSQAQPSLTDCQLCQTVASTKMPGHCDKCIVILWKQDGRTGSKICMLLVCQKNWCWSLTVVPSILRTRQDIFVTGWEKGNPYILSFH